MKKLRMNLGKNSYDILVGKGLLKNVDKYFNLNRKVLIVTDSGVPDIYAEVIAEKCKESKIVVIKKGEKSKNLSTLSKLYQSACDFNLQRSDCVVAVGGGVVGDISGLLSATYMRGVDFYNVPTTLLSQVDSSIGGKTAVDFKSIKNLVGVFYQPKAVLIDTLTLLTLSKRQIKNGLVEAIKMSATCNLELFNKFENYSYQDLQSNIEEIIVESLKIKKSVVEQDERESGLRRVLNFGHTYGHCIEAIASKKGALHGECVALGMLPLSSQNAKERIEKVLTKFNILKELNVSVDQALEYLKKDKKISNDKVNCIFVEEIGSFKTLKLSLEEFADLIRKSV